MDVIIASGIALIGSLAGTFGGIVASNKLTLYRITKLEEKVDKHNNLIERMYEVEKHEALIDSEIERMWQYVDDRKTD